MKTEIKMKPELLIIGKITPRMAAAFDTAFICHHYDEIPDIDSFISGAGKAVQAIATTGHDGVPAPILTGLPDLKIISCEKINSIKTHYLLSPTPIVFQHTKNTYRRFVMVLHCVCSFCNLYV